MQIFSKRILLAPILILLLTLTGNAPPASAQNVTMTLPKMGFSPVPQYFGGTVLFNRGEYKDAMDAYEDAYKRGFKMGTIRWFDTVCYLAMRGEWYYQTRQPRKALIEFDNAATLLTSCPGWTASAVYDQPPKPIQPQQIKQPPWGPAPKLNGIQYGLYPEKVKVMFGDISAQAAQTGGQVSPPVLRSVDAVEYQRVTAHVLRRRAELLGPLGRHLPRSSQVTQAISQAYIKRGHWTQPWGEIALALAYIAEGRTELAKPLLLNAFYINRQLDHPLTAIAKLELGKILLEEGKLDVASKLFYEGLFHAYQHSVVPRSFDHIPDLFVLEDLLYYGTTAHILAGKQEVYPPLQNGLVWVSKAKNRRDFQHLHVALLLNLAESQIYIKNNDPATNYTLAQKTLDQAKRILVSNLGKEMVQGRLGTRYNYLHCMLTFRKAGIEKGKEALPTTAKQIVEQSTWRLQLEYVNDLLGQGLLQDSAAIDLYENLLREPNRADWHTRPLESLAFRFLDAPKTTGYIYWFALYAKQKKYKSAFNVAEMHKRHRFLKSQALGGRVTALRWLLESEDNQVDPIAAKRRDEIRKAYPEYAALSTKARELITLMRKAPNFKNKKLEPMFKELETLSIAQESLIRSMAFHRIYFPTLFPRIRTVEQIQQELPSGHAILIFHATAGHIYALLANNEAYGAWKLGVPAEKAGPRNGAFDRLNAPMAYQKKLTEDIGNYLVQIGMRGTTTLLNEGQLSDEKWKESAAQLLDDLLEGISRPLDGEKADFSVPFEELAIVPDNVIWYVPFETLTVPINQKLTPLIERFRIRYLPLMSYTIGGKAPTIPMPITAVDAGKMSNRLPESVTWDECKKLAQVMSVPMRSLPTPRLAPSRFHRTLYDTLIAYGDGNTVKDLYNFQYKPDPGYKRPEGSQLGNWIAVPRRSPQTLILPTFHTGSEEPKKGIDEKRPGNEIFQTLCGMLSTGAQTLFLSRWNTGGAVNFSVTREFAQELQAMPPATAWQRAALLTKRSPYNIKYEPRVKAATNPKEQFPRAKHPFFWGGYMLVDFGYARKEIAPGAPKAAPLPVGNPGNGMQIRPLPVRGAP